MSTYPENRLNIRIDQQGRVTYEQDPAFAQAYFRPAATPEEARLEEKLEKLRDRLDDLLIDEPLNLYGEAHDRWELRRADLEDKIEELEEELEDLRNH